jgi:hypothetical protein
MENEVWKDVVGYEGLYEVSNLGNVKSLPRIVMCKNKMQKTIIEKILKKFNSGNGYHGVKLSINSKTKTTAVHKLVAMAFLNHKPCGFKLVIDHINDIKTDNRLNNLQLVTQRYNCRKTQNNCLVNLKGVTIETIKHKEKIYKYYRSRININGKKISLGNFKTVEEAHLAYQNAILKHELC